MALKVVGKKAGAAKTAKKATTSKKAGYSAAEKKAYEAGQAYGAAMCGKRVALKTSAEKKSFRAGVKQAGGKK